MLKSELSEDSEISYDTDNSEDSENSESLVDTEENEDSEDLENSEDSENSYYPEQSSYETVLLTTPNNFDSYDYTANFENIQTILIFQTTVIIALGLLVAWVSGNKS